ncbi:Cobalamin synthesis protein cobW C-terminal domain-containing protein [Brevibacterium iodinum ATCC 49514]|uniref:Cobalamin synthesis protein cobW C-terminal domain-containing protein n=2 Tax=Brevibacterium iodinum TaxID=31943 RepID=A0A2H1HY21_9MICO|nr:Cobalamin synthesis protein cobW C-terminal domain-containing protein [Brevibacterium iodinum ATCC 49514]SUW13771.1 Cobalamin synthesis protein cobW C-terminal domain [Brevibacterium iodinum]
MFSSEGKRMQGSDERGRSPIVDGIEAIAVVGLCVAERRRYAMGLARDRGFVFVPAEQTEQGIEAIDRLVDLVGMTSGVHGFVLEHGEGADCAENIGALSAPDSRAVLTDLVCVLDLACLHSDLDSEERAGALVSQIEFASTSALVTPDPADSGGIEEAIGLIAHLAPEASLFLRCEGAVHEPVCWQFGHRPPDAGWTAILNSEFRPPARAGGVRACRFEQARPFHPQRLQAVLSAAIGEGFWGRIVRSAGFAKLASRPYVTAHWDQAGTLLTLSPLSVEPLPGGGPELLALGQDLAFIGFDLDETGLCEALDRAVLTDAELLAGPMAWLEYHDEFPAWDSAHRG